VSGGCHSSHAYGLPTPPEYTRTQVQGPPSQL
jgi:hypothetical protein